MDRTTVAVKQLPKTSTELAASVLALQHGLLPGTLNYVEGDPGAPAANIARGPIPYPRGPLAALALSASGQAAALVLHPAGGEP